MAFTPIDEEEIIDEPVAEEAKPRFIPIEDDEFFGIGEEEETPEPVVAPEAVEPVEAPKSRFIPIESEEFFGIQEPVEPIPATGEEGFLRQAADVPLKIGESINTSLRGLTDLFGADNAISQNLTQNAEWYRSLLSAQALEDEQEIGRILKEAEDKEMLDQLAAGLEAFSVAPVDFVASGIGSLATFAATGVLGRAAAVAGAARAGLTGARAAEFVKRGVQATQLATGAGMGAGIVKGEIYQSVKDEMLAQGKTEEEAKQIAMEAQSYMGKNLDQILLGAGLGTIDAFTGAEKILGKVLTKGGLKPDASRIGNIIKNGITEAVPEFVQAAQEKFASNLALRREGVDVSLTQGIFSQGALEGLVGLGLGVGGGAIEPRIQTEPTKEEVAAAASETQDVARQSMDVAPATASLVEGEAEQIIKAQAETPDERVARLQREAQEAAGIELEEEGAGLPPVEPTPPVTPTPEAAVAPVEPVVPEVVVEPPEGVGIAPPPPRQEFTDLINEDETSDDAYQRYQSQIDEIEDRLEAEGVDIVKLVDPTLAGAQNLIGQEGYTEMPPDLVEAYARREAVGAGQLAQSVGELTEALKNQNISEQDIKRVLDTYAIDVGKVDAFAQYKANEYTKAKVEAPPITQLERVAIALAAERGEMFDAVEDISKETLLDAGRAVKAIQDYFGVRPTEQQRAEFSRVSGVEFAALPPTPEAAPAAVEPTPVAPPVTPEAPATAETRFSQFIQPKERPDLAELPEFKSFEMEVRGVPVRFDIDTTKSDQNTLYLESFRVPRGERRQGIGREAMTNVLRWADENNVTLKGEALTAPADRQYRTPQEIREQGYMTPRELFQFYQTLGWERDPEGPKKTMGIPMVYRPKPAAEVAPTIPQLEPLRRVARAEQTEEDVSGLVGQGLVELYNGQPVLTQAGIEALPEAERPRLTPEARKIQIDTRTSEAAAEAISKNLRIGVDQVPVDVRMPAGWTLVGDVYVPPQPTARITPSDIETAVVSEEAGDVFANLVRRKQEVQPAVLQKPVGSQFQNPEEFRAAFDLRGQGHTRFAIRLDLMQEDGAITEDGKNLILATIWDNNTNDEFLSNMEMGSARKNVKSYGYGGRSRQTVEGGRVEQKPLLELIRATRRGGTEADKRTALTLNTFWHEFGHAGYYSLLDAKQKKAINDAYSKTTRAVRRAFFAEGKSDIENAPYFSKYYAKNESEWFAQSFAEYVITQKSDQKKLVPVFEQLLDKIKAVFTKLFNRKEQVNLNDIFDFILRGEAYGQKPTWQGYTMSTKPAVYGTPRGQAISPEFTKRLLAREQPTTFADERRQQIIDGISLKFKRSKNEYGNNEFKTEYDFGGRSDIVDKISFSLEQFDDSTVAIDYLPSKGGKYANIKLGELEQEFKGRAAAERAIKRAIAEVEMDERVGGATEPAPEAPRFTEGTPEAATLKQMEASMAKVDAASEAKGGKPETQKISDIAANWMDQGGDEQALQDAIVENTNLTPANAAKVAKAIARQYDIQQSIATAFLETQTGLSVEAIPEGATLPPEVDPDRPKPVMVRLFETYMGVKVPPTKLTVNEKTALRDQIRLKAAANREAKKAQQATQSDVIDIIKAMELRGPVRPKQAAALAKRAAKVIWTSEKSMEAFVNYAEKVVINTNYDADLREAKAAQKRAQQLSKSEKVAAPQREVLADIAKIGVNMLDNPAEFAVAVNHYLRGFKSVVSPDYVVIPDAEITSYLSAMQTEADANKAEFDRATNERLATKYGIPLNELEKYLNAENIIRDLASYARREVVEGILTEKAQETLAGLKAYDQTQLRDEQRKILNEMVKVDPRNLDSEERQRFVRIGNNIIFNNQTNGAEYFVATAKGQQMAREMAKDETAIAKNKAWVNLLPSIVSPKLQRGWALELQSVADTFRNAFGKGAMGKVYRMMGMLDLNMAQTKANTQLDQIQEEISAFYNGLEKKYKAAARNQDGILAEGVVGFLIQKVPEKGETESLAQRRNLIQQDIRNRREDGDQDRAEMANRIEDLLQQLDGATVQDILNNLKQNYRPNYDSLMFLKDTLFPKYKEFLKRFDENFNDQANNYENPDYLPIGFVRAGPSLAITEEETGQFYDHVSLRPKQSSYTIKRSDYTQLPTDQSTGTPKEIEFNLRRNAFDSLSDQITKAYTNPAWQRINAFLKTPESIEVFGGRANRDFFIERLNRLRLSRMRRGALSRGYIEKTADVVSVIARKLGTGIALGGVYQTFKQAPDQLITTLATTGRRDLLGKNAMDVLAQQLAPKTLRESTKMLNKFSIGRRGDASAGYKYINQMEGAQTRMERYFTESKWDQAKEQGSKIADIWMVALKKSDFVAAAGSWLTYYRADLAKRGIKFEGWEREAELVDTDPARQDAAAYAEQMTDIYQGSSDPTQMATFAQSGKSGWENLWKSMFVPFNSFAVQQRMRLYSDARDALTKTGVDQKTGYLGLSGTIGGMILFHMVKRLFIPVLSGAGVGVLYGVMGVDVEEPDEEKKKEDLNKRWRQMQGEILANMLVGGTGQIIEAKTIDAFNYAAYLISVQTENESVLDDNGEVMPFSTYVKERSPFWRYQSFDSAYSLGMLEIGLGQAEKAITQSKMLMDSEEMENFTPEEQRLLYFAAVSEWLYTMRLNDADLARLVDKARRDMIKAVKDREKELQRIRSGR